MRFAIDRLAQLLAQHIAPELGGGLSAAIAAGRDGQDALPSAGEVDEFGLGDALARSISPAAGGVRDALLSRVTLAIGDAAVALSPEEAAVHPLTAWMPFDLAAALALPILEA